MKKESQNELTDQWRWKNSGHLRTTCKAGTRSKKNKKDYQQSNTCIYLQTRYTKRDNKMKKDEKGNRNGRKSKGKPCKERIQQKHQARARQSQHADMSFRCRVSGANAAPVKLTGQNYSCTAAPLSFATWPLAFKQNFYLMDPCSALKDFNYHSGRYKCLDQHCGNKTANYASNEHQRTRWKINEWTANST